MDSSISPAKSCAIIFLITFLGLIHTVVVIARNVPISTVTDDQLLTTECVDKFMGQLRSLAITDTETSTSSWADQTSSIVQKYVNCLAGAAHRRSSVVPDNRQQLDGSAGVDEDDEEQRKRLELAWLINKTMTILGATSAKTNAELFSVASRQRESMANNDLRVQQSDHEESDGVQKMAAVRVASRDEHLAMCSTVECLTHIASTTFEPCMRVPETQCSVLITVLEAALKLRQQQQQTTQRQLMSPVVDVESKHQIEELPIISLASSTSSEENIRNRGDKEGTEEVKEEEQQMKLLQTAIFTRLGDLITEYELWRSDKELTKSSVHNVGPNDESVREIAEWHPKLDKETQPNRFYDDERRFSTNASKIRSRRAVNLSNLPFKLPEKMTPETQAILEAYLAWREKNGYGKISGRWGK